MVSQQRGRQRQGSYRLVLLLAGFGPLIWLTLTTPERFRWEQLLMFLPLGVLFNRLRFRIIDPQVQGLGISLTGTIHTAATLVGGVLVGAWLGVLDTLVNLMIQTIQHYRQTGRPAELMRVTFEIVSEAGVTSLGVFLGWALFVWGGGVLWVGVPGSDQFGPLILFLGGYSVITSGWAIPLYRLASPPVPWRHLWALEARIFPLSVIPEAVAAPPLAVALVAWPGWLTAFLVLSLIVLVALARYSADLYEQTLQRVRLEQELVAARQMQASLLPPAPAPLPGWQLAAHWEPAREVSGDFYDFIDLGDGQLGVVIADVADKGAGAALMMAVARTYIRAAATGRPNDPATVLQHANQRLAAEGAAGNFVTACYLVLTPHTGVIQWANAGHPRPLLRRASGEVVTLVSPGMALGVMGRAVYQNAEVYFAPGDALLCYTDGLTEAHNVQLSLFGDERLRTLYEGLEGVPEEVVQRLVAEVHSFMGRAPVADDLTMVALRYAGPASRGEKGKRRK